MLRPRISTAAAQNPGARRRPRTPAADVVPPRLEPAGAAAVTVRFLDPLDAAEPLARRPPGVLGREAGGDQIAFRELEVRHDLGVELGVQLAGAAEGEEPLHDAPRAHALASRKRATSAVARSQLATATRSCSAPVSVSA